MAKKRTVFDDMIDDDVSAENDGPDETERLRKESSGKDRKISELQKELRELQETLSGEHEDLPDPLPGPPREGDLGTQNPAVSETLAALREKLGELRGLEESLTQRERALNWAVEKGISVPLAIGNAGRLEQFQGEVDELYETLRRGLQRAQGINRNLATGDPNRRKPAGPVNTKDTLTIEQLGRMSGAELHRIPDRIREKLQGGKG